MQSLLKYWYSFLAPLTELSDALVSLVSITVFDPDTTDAAVIYDDTDDDDDVEISFAVVAAVAIGIVGFFLLSRLPAVQFF